MAGPHPEARTALNKRAEELLSKVRSFTVHEVSYRAPIFEPDIAIAHHITEKDIKGPVIGKHFDPTTGKISRVLLSTGSDTNCLEGDDCDLLDYLVSQAIKSCNIGNSVSPAFASNYAKEWLLSPSKRATYPDFTQGLLDETIKVIKPIKTLAPIAFLNIEAGFDLGAIHLLTITRDLLDEWHEQTRALWQEPDNNALEEHLQKERRELQGLAAASLTLEAEPNHAIAKTLELAEKAISYLNFFHEANHSPRLICHTRLLGQEYIPRYKGFALGPNGARITQSSQVLPPPQAWVISSIKLNQYNRLGLMKLHELLSTEDETRSGFQAKLLEALSIYSRNSLAREPVEKLIYVLVALESMLLKDQQESIQQNIGERLAFAVGSNGAERQEIVALTKTCYNFRSKYLHHGFNMSSLNEIQRLMQYVWTFFCTLILQHQSIDSKQALLDILDARKFK